MTQTTIEDLKDSINEYAEILVMMHNPPTKRSVFGSWTAVTLAEMYRLVLVVSLVRSSRHALRTISREFNNT